MVRNVCSMFGMERSLGEILFALDLDSRCLHVRCTRLNQLARIALPHVIEIMEGIRNEEYQQVTNAASHLIGFGPGLTPSGDDFLASLIVSMSLSAKYLGIRESSLNKTTDRILAALEGRTNLIGQKLIEYASRGSVSEPMFNLVRAIFLSEQSLIQSTVDILGIGASSGRDSMLGIILGIYESIQLIKK